MEIELAALLLVQLVGSIVFARFEIETSVLKKIIKWIAMDAVTIGAYFIIGHYSLLFPFLIIGGGTTFHFIWCKRHGIDPMKATPRRKYYELRGWKWEE